MVSASNSTAIVPLIASLGAIGALATAWWSAYAPRALGWLFACALIAGQVVRLPLPGQGGGLLISDGIAMLTVILALIYVALRGVQNTFVVRLTLLTLPFIIWSLWTLLASPLHLDGGQVVVALSYWVRLTVYLLLIPALLVRMQ